MNSIQVDPPSKGIFFCFTVCQLFLANGLYLFACVATFLIMFFLIQQAFVSGVFIVMLMSHILQIIAGVWLCNYLGNDINYRSPETGVATIASLIGVVFLFLPIIYVQTKLPKINITDIRNSVNELSTEKTMYCYLASFFFLTFLGLLVSSTMSGISQIVFSLAKIKWLFFLLFGYQSIVKKEKRGFFYFAIGFEFLSGFFSYFSEFKTVIYFLIILLLTLVESINVKQIIYLLLIAVVMVPLALFWSSIKGSYRAFLNGGQKAQVVVVSNDEALNKLESLSNNVDENTLEGSIIATLDRIQYTYTFAKTIERVPAIIPFQDGNNWLGNIIYCTTPRFLNPDKSTLDNSIKTSKYTGIQHLSAKKGVSFSLGYFAEFYIDFGFYGMMLGILALGAIYAMIYSYFMHKASGNLVFNYAVVGSFFFEFSAFEADGTFLLGRLLASLVTYVVLIQFAFPFLLRFITIDKSSAKVQV